MKDSSRFSRKMLLQRLFRQNLSLFKMPSRKCSDYEVTDQPDQNNRRVIIIDDGDSYKFCDPSSLKDPRFETLPFSIRILLESALRHSKNGSSAKDVNDILDWEKSINKLSRPVISFYPQRMIMPPPSYVDLAVMRDAFSHVERYRENFKNLKLIEHPSLWKIWPVELDALTCSPFRLDYDPEHILDFTGMLRKVIVPDSVVSMESRIATMAGGMGILGWSLTRESAEKLLLGQPLEIHLPAVVGFRLNGKLSPSTAILDIVAAVQEKLIDRVSGFESVDDIEFIEFFGPGCGGLSVADRATICGTCSACGQFVALFPGDSVTLDYFRNATQTACAYYDKSLMEPYFKESKLFRLDSKQDPKYTEVIELDLSEIKGIKTESYSKRSETIPFITSVRSLPKDDMIQCLMDRLQTNQDRLMMLQDTNGSTKDTISDLKRRINTLKRMLEIQTAEQQKNNKHKYGWSSGGLGQLDDQRMDEDANVGQSDTDSDAKTTETTDN